jgi:hypothetical protein
MGRTNPSFRIAAEMERRNWKPLRQALDKKDRKMFDEMFYLNASNKSSYEICSLSSEYSFVFGKLILF